MSRAGTGIGFDRVRRFGLRGAAAVVCLAGVFCASCSNSRIAQPPQATLGRDVDERAIKQLLEQMTLEEKIAQLTQPGGGEPRDSDPLERQRRYAELLAGARNSPAGSYLGACGAEHTNRLQAAVLEGSRLKIPALMAQDVIHGYRTIFPTPLAESCSWDPSLAERTAAAAAREARAAGVHWTFAPMVDIARDPRWGRIVEGSGEDPRLGAAFAAARVHGFQGDDPSGADRLLACAKHFAAYGAGEGGRDYNTVDLSMSTLRQVYLPPFHAAARAGVASFMTAFNEINGVPCSGNRWLFQDLLRDEWGFDGVVVSDFESVKEMVAHGVAGDEAQAARLALDAGVDIDMVSRAYAENLPALVRSGAVAESRVDEAVMRVLRMKARVGLLGPSAAIMADPEHEKRVLLSAEHRALAREAAARSMVLLKNSPGVLPLREGLKRVLVIGPLANSGGDMIGPWACTGRGEEAVSALDGLRELGKSKGFDVEYQPGCDALAESAGGLQAAADAARSAELVIAVVGEPESITAEGNSRSMVEIPAPQQRLLEAVAATGTPVVAVLMIGRPLAISWVQEHAAAVVVCWHAGTEGGHGLADVLGGAVNPSGRLTTSFPRTPGQVPIYYNHKPTGRPFRPGERFVSRYLDTADSPLYAFGYGLSYTTFELSGARADRATVQERDTITLSVDVSNTGPREGAEVVQWYMHDPVGSQTRPVRELVGFARVELRPGERRTISISLPARELGFIGDDGRWMLEPGEIRLHASNGQVRTDELVVTIGGR